MDKYPNVFLTQGLMDLCKIGLVDENPKKETSKLKVISQIVEDEYPLPDDGEEPIGFEKDPWVDEDYYDYNLKGLSEDDFLDEKNLPGYYQDNEPFDLNNEEYIPFDNSTEFNVDGPEEPGDWKSNLKNWFKQREQ